MKILDVGCGKSKYPGSIGIDISEKTDADVIHDLNKIPYPFEDNTFDYIICDNDDEIDWSRTCKTKPSERDPNELNKIRAVYWKNWIWDMDYVDDKKPDGKERWNDTPKENF